MMNISDTFGMIPPEFVLLGLSWVQDQKIILSLIVLPMYVLVILGNCSLVLLVRVDRKLHEPMHIFISLLSLIDISISTIVIPKVLAILWFDSTTISATGCLTQIYFLYTMIGLESSLFALMSIDRYVAICHPLRHSSIMTSSFIMKSVLVFVIKCTVLILPLPILTAHLSFCKMNIILHSFCEYIEVIKLSCGDLAIFLPYMIFLIFFISGLDNAQIVFSYVRILVVVQMMKSSEARWKALNTCSSHIILLSLFYISSIFPLMFFLFHSDPPLKLKMLPMVTSFLILPMINPIVYGVKTKEIQEGFKRLYWRHAFF